MGDDDDSMSREDWIDHWNDFVCRLSVRSDDNYAPGAFADPGDLLNYSMSTVPRVGRLCEISSRAITVFFCRGLVQREKEEIVCEHGIYFR